MTTKKYEGYECGDFLSEMQVIQDALSGDGSITLNRLKELDSKLKELLLAVGMSSMGNGHGQKESIYEKAFVIYQMIVECLLTPPRV